MMLYLEYLIFGTPMGLLSLILFITGIILFIRYFKQPAVVKAPLKRQTIMPGFFCTTVGLVGIIVVMVLAQTKITADQYRHLIAQAKDVPPARKLLASHMKEHDKITKLHYFQLQRDIHHFVTESHKETIHNWDEEFLDKKKKDS